jgi:uncharacterized membrane protein YagU involved in acid resistance
MRDVRASAIAGAAAGLVGTVVMTGMMKPGAARLLPRSMQPREFLPQKVIQWAEAVAGVSEQVSEREETALIWPAHLGYGTAMGAFYGMLRPRFDTLPAPLAGAAYGLVVWALGYQGWMPALGVQPATTEKPPEKWPVPIGSHLVYGVALAITYQKFRPVSRRGPEAG